jgi:hypothetical protein
MPFKTQLENSKETSLRTLGKLLKKKGKELEQKETYSLRLRETQQPLPDTYKE